MIKWIETTWYENDDDDFLPHHGEELNCVHQADFNQIWLMKKWCKLRPTIQNSIQFTIFMFVILFFFFQFFLRIMYLSFFIFQNFYLKCFKLNIQVYRQIIILSYLLGTYLLDYLYLLYKLFLKPLKLSRYYQQTSKTLDSPVTRHVQLQQSDSESNKLSKISARNQDLKKWNSQNFQNNPHWKKNYWSQETQFSQ